MPAVFSCPAGHETPRLLSTYTKINMLRGQVKLPLKFLLITANLVVGKHVITIYQSIHQGSPLWNFRVHIPC